MILTAEFLSQGGELGALMRAKAWDDTPLGAPDGWPAALKHTLRMILSSHQPMLIWWETELYQFYNDAYRATMGPERHPGMLGQPGRQSWGEVWSVVGPQVDSIMAGGAATWHRSELIPVTRHGAREDVWWDYGYSPIRDEHGVRGVLVICSDVSAEHRAKVALEALNQRFMEEITRRQLSEQNQTLQLQVADTLRGLADSDAIAKAAFDMLSGFLPVAQIDYAEVDASASRFVIRHSWKLDPVPSLCKVAGDMDAYGPAVIGALRNADVVTIDDVQQDSRTAGHVTAYTDLHTCACMLVPVMKTGALVAILTLHQNAPCQWSPGHIPLVRDIGERIWNAMEHADAQQRQRDAEQALMFQRRADNERLRSLFEQAPGFMVILSGPQHVYEFVNAAYTRVVGERPLLGLTVREALPEVAGQGFFELLDEAYASATPRAAHDVALVVQASAHEPARRSYVDFVYQPILDAGGAVTGIFVEGSDTTERHLAKEALDISRARLSEGMVAARMAIWDWDLVTEQIIFSQNTNDVFGGTWDSIADVWKSVCEEDLERLTLAGEAAEAQCGSYEEVVRINRSGVDKPLWLQIHGKFIADESGVARTVRSVAIDVTGLKDAQKALQDADVRKDEFLAMLAHELRNPLAPIRAAAQLLEMVHGDARQVQRTGAVIARQADHMTSLINDLLDVSRVTTGRVMLDKSAQDIGSIIGESVEQVMPMLQERCHRLSIDNPGLPVMVMGDRKRLVQVLTNLLQNAAKYTPAKGHIRVEVNVASGDVAVTIRDDGVGMNAELLPHVFELFSQEKRASDRSLGGLGLGLALVQRLVALHGGRVTAHSDGAGCGAAFTVFLPAHAALAGAMLPAAAGAGAPDMVPLRVMVVDDNADAANILGMWLESFGHHVRVEYSASAVLEHAAHSHYDVYVLDIGLPGVDGNELARLLRLFPQNANATLIANTGYGGAYDRAEAMAAGFDHYFVKPLNLVNLERVLAGITQRATPRLAA
ncbi:MAG: ATP-binding protein [Telluria sp.]